MTESERERARDTSRILTLGVYNVCARADAPPLRFLVTDAPRHTGYEQRKPRPAIESDREKYKVCEVHARERERERARAILAVQLGTPQIFNRHPLDHHPLTASPRLILRPFSSLPSPRRPDPLPLYSSSFLPRPPPDQWGC